MTPWTREPSLLKVPFAIWSEAIAVTADQNALVGVKVPTGKGEKKKRGNEGWLLGG